MPPDNGGPRRARPPDGGTRAHARIVFERAVTQGTRRAPVGPVAELVINSLSTPVTGRVPELPGCPF